MKLFVWKPNGHGQKVVVVMADTEEQAYTSADAVVAAGDRYDFQGWGTDYYELEVFEAGQVVVLDND